MMPRTIKGELRRWGLGRSGPPTDYVRRLLHQKLVASAPTWRGCCTTAWSLRPLICGSGDVLTFFSPPWKSRFPATETAVGRDSVRMGSYCAGSPSIWCWRDHSAGRSARRTTPMPCGSRPSIAALMRSGARKASEIVMLTLRTLQPSRVAMLAAFAVGGVCDDNATARIAPCEVIELEQASTFLDHAQSRIRPCPGSRVSRRTGLRSCIARNGSGRLGMLADRNPFSAE
jgi:hypothetical protein